MEQIHLAEEVAADVFPPAVCLEFNRGVILTYRAFKRRKPLSTHP